MSSREYVRKYRERMKQQGYVKKEVYIPNEYGPLLRQIEQLLRLGIEPKLQNITKGDNDMATQWTNESLFAALSETQAVTSGEMKVEQVNNALVVTVEEYQEFPVILSVSGLQMLAVSTLFPVNDVPSGKRAEINERMLAMNPLLPLSDFAIMNGNYVLFGSLSSNSGMDDVLTEIRMLSTNMVEAVESVSYTALS